MQSAAECSKSNDSKVRELRLVRRLTPNADRRGHSLRATTVEERGPRDHEASGGRGAGTCLCWPPLQARQATAAASSAALMAAITASSVGAPARACRPN